MFSLFSRRIQYAGVMSCAVIMSVVPVFALSIDQVPNPRQTNGGWVTDMADLLSQPTETQLNKMISELEAQNGSEIAIVTVPGTAPSQSPKAFATKLFNTWGIGKKEKDNGVLFLISKRDRRIEIETGYGIEAILPNSEVKQIIDSQITPTFKRGNFDLGTLDGTAHLIKALQDDTTSTNSKTAAPSRIENAKETRSASDNWPRTLTWVFILCSIIFSLFDRSKSGGSGSSRGGSGGGSGGGFGGGSSGGGGAGGGF